MKNLIFTTLLTLLFSAVVAQINFGDKYYVYFTDKFNSPYSIENPEEFLSQRAIERRERFNIPIDEHDLPVNPQYIQTVKNIGVQVSNPSKWLNGIIVETTDPSKIEEIEALPFVKSTYKNIYFGKDELADFDDRFDLNKPFGMTETIEPVPGNLKNAQGVNNLNYGDGYNQIDMIGGISLHNDGYQGQGMIIAVLDAGFSYANTMAAFDSLYMNGQILGARDFVAGDENAYQGSTHGTSVLSTMGGNLPGQLVGTAPKASYWLLRTEDAASEYLIEEYNWVTGAEFADSVGADVLNTSLGYIGFDDPSQSHAYEDMDGNTTPITIGADRAVSRGMIAVNSAGNSGSSSTWPWIGAPADGDSVFSIGAVNSSGQLAGFSSRGPTADGRIKPDISAQGQGTVIASTNGGTATSSGTSFSSPIIAGMTACLWQMFPEKTNTEIVNSIKMSGNYAGNPNNDYGHGIPDYSLASIIVSSFDKEKLDNANAIEVFPNPFSDQVKILFNAVDTQSVQIQIVDLTGRQVYMSEKINRRQGLNYHRIEALGGLKNGFYIVNIIADNTTYAKMVAKVD
jgi:serine protease AprX